MPRRRQAIALLYYGDFDKDNFDQNFKQGGQHRARSSFPAAL